MAGGEFAACKRGAHASDTGVTLKMKPGAPLKTLYDGHFLFGFEYVFYAYAVLWNKFKKM